MLTYVSLGDGVAHRPYATLDVTTTFAHGGSVVVALQTMHATAPSALLQLQFRMPGGKVITIGTDATWQAFNGDVHRNPGKPTQGGSAGVFVVGAVLWQRVRVTVGSIVNVSATVC